MELALPPMPFSVVGVPVQGVQKLSIPEEMATRSDDTIALPPGVVQVIVTWEGTEAIRVWHARGEVADIVSMIPAVATPGQRSTGVLTLASDEPHRISLVMQSSSWSQNTLDKNYVVGVQVMPMGTAADITGGGSMLRVDNSVGTRVFLGDTMIHGDTGERDVSADLTYGWTGTAKIYREGNTVFLNGDLDATNMTRDWFLYLNNGFRPNAGALLGHSLYANMLRDVRSSGGHLYVSGGISFTGRHKIFMRWYTTDPWPATLPGVAA